MKKLGMWVLIVFPFVALGVLFLSVKSAHQLPTEVINSAKVPLEFKDNTIQCPQCHMYLVGKKHTAQIITTDLKTHFFDDIGCAIIWMKEQKIEPKSITMWVFSNDTHRYIDAFKAFYSTQDTTPMQYGFGAYEEYKESYIAFDEMRLHMLRGETMQDPKIKQHAKGH